MRSPRVTTLTLESIEGHHNWSIGRGQAENTAKAYRSDLREFLKAVGCTSIPMEDFEDLAQVWLNQTRREMAPKTTGRRLTSLRSFSRWAGYPEYLSEYVAPVPAKGQPHPLPEGIPGVLRLIDLAKNAEQKALVALCGLAGLRIGEALNSCTQHFDLHDMMLTIRGKGDKSRVVPVSTACWGAISTAFVDASLRADTHLIRYQDRSARKAITTLGIKAGMSRTISSHDLRATFATAAFDHTKDQRVVQELLGHSSGSTTEIYIGVTRAKMKTAVEF